MAFYVDCLWNNKFEFKNKVLDIQNHKYDCPLFIYNIEYKSSLSARLLKSASNQACVMVSAALAKHKRCLYVLNNKKQNKERTRKLTKLLSKKPLIKPKCDNINLEFNSINAKIVTETNLKYFDGILQLHALGLKQGKLFSCKNCLFQSDADLNASLNHEQELPSANFLLLHRGKIKEFIWKNDGFFNLNGSELTVPNTKK